MIDLVSQYGTNKSTLQGQKLGSFFLGGGKIWRHPRIIGFSRFCLGCYQLSPKHQFACTQKPATENLDHRYTCEQRAKCRGDFGCLVRPYRWSMKSMQKGVTRPSGMELQRGATRWRIWGPQNTRVMKVKTTFSGRRVLRGFFFKLVVTPVYLWLFHSTYHL